MASDRSLRAADPLVIIIHYIKVYSITKQKKNNTKNTNKEEKQSDQNKADSQQFIRS